MNVKKDLLSMGLEFTETYKKYRNVHPGIREMNTLKGMPSAGQRETNQWTNSLLDMGCSKLLQIVNN